MIVRDEDALICDLWEVYGVTDYKALPLTTTARLFWGLRENSRCKMRLGDITLDAITTLMAAAVDRLNILAWQNTEDARNGRNKPKSILNSMLGLDKEDKQCRGFSSGEEFERARAEILKRGGKQNE